MLIDPVALAIEVLTKAGHTEVHEDLESRALASPEFIVVQEFTGTVPHGKYSDRSTLQIVLYSNQGKSRARSLSYQVISDLVQAHASKFDNGGIHHVRVVLRPSRMDVAGQPNNVARVMFQVELGLSSLESWR